jgi:hypothetical protein
MLNVQLLRMLKDFTKEKRIRFLAALPFGFASWKWVRDLKESFPLRKLIIELAL